MNRLKIIILKRVNNNMAASKEIISIQLIIQCSQIINSIIRMTKFIKTKTKIILIKFNSSP